MLNELIFYKTPDGEQRIEVVYENENFWMSQAALAELFGVKRPAITKHLGTIFSTGELVEKEVSSILEHTTQHGAIEGKTQTQKVKFYNLDAIIAVGYRVNSYQATQFRIWATKTLKEFVIKGFVMDDERLKQGKSFGQDYFDELLERIREIRASERREGILGSRQKSRHCVGIITPILILFYLPKSLNSEFKALKMNDLLIFLYPSVYTEVEIRFLEESRTCWARLWENVAPAALHPQRTEQELHPSQAFSSKPTCAPFSLCNTPCHALEKRRCCRSSSSSMLSNYL